MSACVPAHRSTSIRACAHRCTHAHMHMSARTPLYHDHGTADFQVFWLPHVTSWNTAWLPGEVSLQTPHQRNLKPRMCPSKSCLPALGAGSFISTAPLHTGRPPSWVPWPSWALSWIPGHWCQVPTWYLCGAIPPKYSISPLPFLRNQLLLWPLCLCSRSYHLSEAQVRTLWVTSASSPSLLSERCSVQCPPLFPTHVHITSVRILTHLYLDWAVASSLVPLPLVRPYSDLVKRSDTSSQLTTPTTPLAHSKVLTICSAVKPIVFPMAFFLANRV